MIARICWIPVGRSHETGWPESRSGVGLIFALGHWALIILIQLENFFFYVLRPEDGLLAPVSFVFSLPFLQLENISVALAIWALAFPLHGSRILKTGYILLVSSLNFYLIADQVAYKLFFDHLQFSMLEGGNELFSIGSSALAEVDACFFLNLFVVLLLTGLYARVLFSQKSRIQLLPLSFLSGLHRFPRLYWLLTGFALLSLVVTAKVPSCNLQHHPLLRLLESGLATSSSKIQGLQKIEDFARPRFGKQENNPDEKRKLSQVANRLKQSAPLNIILIGLESVGSRQLLKQGRPSPAMTPVLSRLSQNSILFDSIYSVFPGSTRSCVAMCTGGRFITWGSVYKELSYPYKGPTLAGELKKRGYRTALFSSGTLETENLAGFMKTPAYDTYFDFGEALPEFRKAHQITQWGGDEAPVMSRAMDWVESRKRGKPFFLHFLTNLTHHPYAIPKGYPGPLKGATRESRYQNAMHYLDFVLGQMIRRLEKNNLLKNTLLIITGDHGEAFGRLHRGNLTHRNFLYEENVRSFLMIAQPVLISGPVVSSRVGTVGDIMPTILSLVSRDRVSVPGQDLLSDRYQLKVVFFHKNAGRELWGLRDGKWKYIAPKLGGKAELFDLEADPEEQRNLAGQHPEMTRLYDQLIPNWYLEINRDFVQRLKGFHYIGGTGLRLSDLKTPGPKVLAFGYSDERNDEERFVEAKTLHPLEEVLAWTKWVAYPEDRWVQYEWVSPSGKIRTFNFKVQSEWTFTRVHCGVPLPMEEGRWILNLKDGDRTLIAGNFIVSSNATLNHPPPPPQRARKIIRLTGGTVKTRGGKKIAAGRIIYLKGEAREGEVFVETPSLRPHDKAALRTQWEPVDRERKIRCRWTSPSGRRLSSTITVKSGWTLAWAPFPQRGPMEKGKWSVALWEGEIQRGSSHFSVGRK